MPRKAPKFIEPTSLATDISEHRLLTDRQVAELTGLNRRRRLELEKRRAFPQPIRVTNKILLYPSSKIVQWIQHRSRGL